MSAALGRRATLLGFVDLQSVWIDDRARCRWALRAFDLTVLPGQLVAVVGGTDEGGPDALVDVLAGRRVPPRGQVTIDGIDLRHLDRAAHRRTIVELDLRPGGERRLCLPQSTIVAVRPSPATLASADTVVTIVDGVEALAG